MHRLIFAFVLCLPVSAAVTAPTIWEARSAGSATSGGGFDSTIAGAGTDMSQFDNKNLGGCTSCQSATVNISTADAVTNNTTTVTSATANFSSALIGNTIYLAGGGTTTGWYQVTAVGSSTSITVDRATGGAGGSSQTMNIGGAIGTSAGFAVLEIAEGIKAGNIVYVKAGGWTAIVTHVFNQAGTAGNPITYKSYTSTRTDNGQATVQSATANAEIFDITGANHRFIGFIAERTAGATVRGFQIGATGTILKNCKSLNTTGAGFYFTTGAGASQCIDCWASGTTGGAGFSIDSSGYPRLIGAVASGGTVNGFSFAASDTEPTSCMRCIAANNTGGSSHGFTVTGTSPVMFSHIVAYGNGAAGLNITTSQAQLVVINSIFYGNTTYGIASTTNFIASGTFQLLMDYNAFGTNTTDDRSNVPTGPNDKDLDALGGNPFTDAANMNFTLDASGKTDIGGAGFPGALQSGGTGYASIGALEPQNTGSGAGQRGYTFIGKARPNADSFTYASFGLLAVVLILLKWGRG